MCLYVNMNGLETACEGITLNNLAKNEGVNIYERSIESFEKYCFVSLIDISMFKDKKINLKSGMDIGLSRWLKLFTISIIEPENKELMQELDDVDVCCIKKQDIQYCLKDIINLIKKIEHHKNRMLQKDLIETNFQNDIELRRKIRAGLCITMAMGIEGIGKNSNSLSEEERRRVELIKSRYIDLG